jgi:two-component system CheB/CheR fusion protein
MFADHPTKAARPRSVAAVRKVRQDEDAELASRLKRELAATREYLQAVIEQQEAANEELQSANEEVQSSNEELQSINEELETSKEEIQSSNEELATVNDELQNRNLELTQSNNDLLNLIHSVQMPLVMLGSDLRIRRFTPAAEKMLNLIAADVGRPIRDIRLNISVSNLEEKLIKAIDTVTVLEEEIQDPAGRWHLLRIRPYRTLDNRIEGALLLLVDIDALKRNQEDLRRQANLLHQAHEPIFVWDYAGPVTFWNPAAEECYGYSREHALGKARSELLQSDVPADFFRTALLDAGQWTGELTHTGRNGEQIVVDARMVLVREPSGTMVLETHHPITQRKRMEHELRTRAVELAAMDQRKNEFLAILAHELRNPLAPLSTALHLIKEQLGPVPPGGEALRIMERQLRRLTQLVDDLLDISRITRGRIELRLEPIDLTSFLPEVVQGAQTWLNGRDQEIVVSVPEEPLVVEGDPARLEQVFGNLLSNASKFSAKGSSIKLTARADARRRQAIVSVSDSGIGIAAADLPNVFNLFTQVNPTISRNTGGLGIGLNLAQELAHLHRGSIAAHSAGLNQGSEFVVRLPLVKQALTPPSQQAVRTRTGDPVRRVLVVDDNQDAARSLADFLRMSGHVVEVQTTSKGALEIVDGFRPDTIVLDLGLPTMDGFEVARRLREMPSAKNVLLVALSGYGQEEHRRHSRQAGFDHHMTKPADLDLLLDLLATTAADASGR